LHAFTRSGACFYQTTPITRILILIPSFPKYPKLPTLSPDTLVCTCRGTSSRICYIISSILRKILVERQLTPLDGSSSSRSSDTSTSHGIGSDSLEPDNQYFLLQPVMRCGPKAHIGALASRSGTMMNRICPSVHILHRASGGKAGLVDRTGRPKTTHHATSDIDLL
jgi:hypothetical protein